MKILSKTKDGGPESPVDGYFLVEIKGLFSIALLKFNKGCREAYHTHAFNAFTWFLKGSLVEQRMVDGVLHEKRYEKSLLPKLTTRDNLHRVVAKEDSWCLTVRGPWCKQWTEYKSITGTTTVLESGRVVVSETND